MGLFFNFIFTEQIAHDTPSNCEDTGILPLFFPQVI